tara:strand:- start:348 stop:656 length:309 start_codon:yes stop_codon:yes gene_type:complete
MIWYKKTRKLKQTNVDNILLFLNKVLTLLKDIFEEVFRKRKIDNGSVTKKTYMPEILCVIDIKADIGSRILNRLMFTGLAIIVFWDICLFVNKSCLVIIRVN